MWIAPTHRMHGIIVIITGEPQQQFVYRRGRALQETIKLMFKYKQFSLSVCWSIAQLVYRVYVGRQPNWYSCGILYGMV